MLHLSSAPPSLTQAELVKRMRVHRGVYCQRGLLRPSLSTVYHVCPAEHFNKQLPLSLDGISGYLSPQLMHNHGATKCYSDLPSLLADVTVRRLHLDPRAMYVVQVEVDLLTAPIADPSAGGPKTTLFIEGPINCEAITRVWLAKREILRDESLGAFQSVQPPTGVPDACFASTGAVM